MQFHTTTMQSVGEEKGSSYASKHQLTPAATCPKNCLQYSGVITFPAPSTVSWMQVIRPAPVSVNAKLIQNSRLQSKHHRIHGQTIQSLEWLLGEAVA